MKIVICLIHYIIVSLVKISNKFDPISMGYIQKTAQKQPKILLSAGMKMKMRLGPDMYHLNTFNITKHKGVNKWAVGERNQKTIRKCHEIKRILTFASSKTNSDNFKEKGIFHCHQ